MSLFSYVLQAISGFFQRGQTCELCQGQPGSQVQKHFRNPHLPFSKPCKFLPRYCSPIGELKLTRATPSLSLMTRRIKLPSSRECQHCGKAFSLCVCCHLIQLNPRLSPFNFNEELPVTSFHTITPNSSPLHVEGYLQGLRDSGRGCWSFGYSLFLIFQLA